MTDLQTIDRKGHTIRIVVDEDPTSPREWDNLGTILYTSSRYELGDRQVSAEEIDEVLARDDVIALPVYAYIHGGIALSTGAFSCPWDSGQCGIVYCETATAREEWGDDFTEDRARSVLRAEVDTFSKYLDGGVVGYVVELDGEPVASCWGYYDEDDAIADAVAEVDASPVVLYPNRCDCEVASCSS
jgi:hypothetical protein